MLYMVHWILNSPRFILVSDILYGYPSKGLDKVGMTS